MTTSTLAILAPETEVTPVAALSALETQATEHLTVWKHAYWQFWTVLLEIRDTGVWEQSGQGTWEGYLNARWLPELEVSYNRIRQIQAAYPIMKMIEGVTGVTPNENQIRNLKAAVPDEDRHLMPEVYTRTLQFTSEPSKRHFEAAYGVLKDRETTNTATIAGESRRVDVVDESTREAIEEADKRRKQHIADNTPKTRALTITPELVQTHDGRMRYAFPENLPLWIFEKSLTIYVADSGEQEAA